MKRKITSTLDLLDIIVLTVIFCIVLEKSYV